MADENYEWAGVYKATDAYMVADYVGNQTDDIETIVCNIIYDEKGTEKDITEIMKFIFSDSPEFIMKYNTPEQTLSMHVSWDYIVDFLSKHIEGRKTKKFSLVGKMRNKE